jgi:glycosyltransferase involved in cell wall biosynthesis
MRLIILENNLRELLGHFLNSTIGLANAARHSPQISDVRVYCHNKASKEVLRLAGAVPLFQHVTWQRKKYVEPITSMQKLGAVYAKNCSQLDDFAAEDIILVPTAQENQVFGLSLFLASLPETSRPQVVLNFHVDNWTGNAQRTAAIRAAFDALADTGSDNVIVTAPTPELAARLSKVCPRIPVRTYPLPQNYDLCVNDEPRNEHPSTPTVAIMGRPIKRKGSVDIGEIISEFRERSPDARFLVQCTATSPGLLKLMLSPNVSVKTGGLTPQQYGNMLRSADILLMPYATDAYKDRTSGIFADCAAYGKIAVVPNGTWMARQIEDEHAAGIVYEAEADNGPGDALMQAIEGLDTIRESAKERASYWSKKQSAAAYIDKLLTEINCAPVPSLLPLIGTRAENDPSACDIPQPKHASL